MYDKKLAKRVKKLLEENSDKQYKIKDISKVLKVGKHKYRDLVDTLFGMVKDEEIKLQNRKYTSKKSKGKTVEGVFDARSLAKERSFAFVNCKDYDVFVSSEDTMNAFHNDKVLVEIKYNQRGKRYGTVIKILERATDTFVGTIEEYRGKYYLIPDNTKVHTNFMINQPNDLKLGHKAVLKITNWGSPALNKFPGGEITEILGKAGEPEIEVLSVIKQYDLPLEFPDDVLAETALISDEIDEEELDKREDLRDLITITIDPASAKDYDDAISLSRVDNGWQLYVHIADVAHYIETDTLIFREAVKRGNSYYFPGQVIPMLPQRLSNKVCSLRPYEDKLTLSVVTEYDELFNVKHQSVCESIICSNARLTYDEVDDLFENDTSSLPSEVSDMLHNLKKLSQSLTSKRVKAGYLRFDLPETEYIFDDDGHVVDLKRSRETESHEIIENTMLVANEYVANRLSNNDTMYRIHEKPDEMEIENIQNLADSFSLKFEYNRKFNYTLQILLDSMPAEYHRVFDRMILRNLKRARYDTENKGHFGLAMNKYTHFTSPIRRLCDLVIHHQIKAMAHQSESPFDRKTLDSYAEQATERELLADETEWEVDRKNKIKFMKKRIGNEYSGIIVNARSSAIFVELDKYPVVGIIDIASIKDDYYVFNENKMSFTGKRGKKQYGLADKVKVLVSRVDEDIYFNLS